MLYAGDPSLTYTWTEIKAGVRWLGRALRRVATRAVGWVRWQVWGRMYARESIALYETTAKLRSRGPA